MKTRLAAMALCLFVATGTRAAHAQANAAAAVAAPIAEKQVAVRLAGDARAIAAVEAVLRERIAGQGLDAEVDVVTAIDRASVLAPRETSRARLADVWVDLADRSNVTLYIVDAAHDRVLVRAIAPEENPEVAWEEIGHIVEVALGALRAGETIGVERAELLPAAQPTPREPPPAAPDVAPAAPPAPPRARWTGHGGVLFGARAFGDGEIAAGPGGILEGHRRSDRFAIGGMLLAEIRLPSTIETASASVRVQSTTMTLLASGALALSRRSEIGLGIGGGVELVRAEARNVGDGESLRLAGEKLDAMPVARGLLRYVYSAPYVRAFAGIGVDLPTERTRYVVARPDESLVLFSPWLARPFVMLGIETP